MLTYTIAHRIGRYLERHGLLVRGRPHRYFTRPAVSEKRLSLTMIPCNLVAQRVAEQSLAQTLNRGQVCLLDLCH